MENGSKFKVTCKDLENIFKALAFEIIETSDRSNEFYHPVAYVRIYKDSKLGCTRKILYMNPEFLNGDEEIRKIVLMHELMHVMRRDIAIMKNAKSKKESTAYNIAMDLVINWTIDRDDKIEELGGLTYRNVLKKIPGIPHPTLGYKTIFDFLMKSSEEDLNRLNPDDIGFDGEISEEDLKELEKEIRRVSRENPGVARKIFEVMKELEDSMRDRKKRESGAECGSSDSDKNARGNYDFTGNNNYSFDRRLATVMKTIKNISKYGTCARSRTYCRPGRVEEIRGILDRKNISVHIALDVSGSMSDLIPGMNNSLKRLRNEFREIEVIIWADNAARCENLANPPNVGYGTDPKSILRCYAKSNLKAPSVLVVITDCVFEDIEEEVETIENFAASIRSRLIWVVPHSAIRNNVFKSHTVPLE